MSAARGRRTVWLAGSYGRSASATEYLAHRARTPDGRVVGLALHGVGLGKLTAGDVIDHLDRAFEEEPPPGT